MTLTVRLNGRNGQYVVAVGFITTENIVPSKVCCFLG